MFHYLNYGARPVYSQRPDKATLIVSMSEATEIKTFNELMRRVAMQCEKLDQNFPGMIPAFSVVLEMEILMPPTIAPPYTALD